VRHLISRNCKFAPAKRSNSEVTDQTE
jgi:hypothetical protein